jgi:hypothetical protein
VTELFVPEDHVVDRVSVERLDRQLAAADDTVSAIVAPVAPLRPGASMRTAAEWASLQPLRGSLAPADHVRGAAVVRDGVRFDSDDAVVHVEQGNVLVDHGAVTHAAHDVPVELEDADPTGRSPFPRRPMVLLMGLTDDTGRAVWARDLVNASRVHAGPLPRPSWHSGRT